MTAAAGMAQVNVRMSPELKARAEARFAEEGYTSTQVIRRVYELCAQGIPGFSRLFHWMAEVVLWKEDELKELERVEHDRGEEFSRRVEERYRQFYLEVGLDPDNLPELPDVDYDELLVSYYDDRDRERGLGIYAV